jgi:hypothetical protein
LEPGTHLAHGMCGTTHPPLGDQCLVAGKLLRQGRAAVMCQSA